MILNFKTLVFSENTFIAKIVQHKIQSQKSKHTYFFCTEVQYKYNKVDIP